MTLKELSDRINEMTDAELYKEISRLLYNCFRGYKISETTLKYLFQHCEENNSDIYRIAMNDAWIKYLSYSKVAQNAELNIIRPIFHTKDEFVSNYAEYNQYQLIEKLFEGNKPNNDIWNTLDVERNNLLIIEVKGDSMINAGFDTGDIILVDTMKSVEHNNIIVAELNHTIYVKRYKISEGSVFLHSENEKYPPYRVNSEDNFEVIGVVKQVIKKVI